MMPNPKNKANIYLRKGVNEVHITYKRLACNPLKIILDKVFLGITIQE